VQAFGINIGKAPRRFCRLEMASCVPPSSESENSPRPRISRPWLRKDGALARQKLRTQITTGGWNAVHFLADSGGAKDTAAISLWSAPRERLLSPPVVGLPSPKVACILREALYTDSSTAAGPFVRGPRESSVAREAASSRTAKLSESVRRCQN